MFFFIAGLATVLAGIGTIFYGRREGEAFIKVAGTVAVIGGIFAVFGSMATTVDARSVGIVTSFNKYHSSIGPGFQMKAPWHGVEEWTTRNQVTRFANGTKDENEDDNFHAAGCITVRLGNQSNACVDVTVTWAITKDSVKGLWEQHKTFDAARRDFVTPQSISAVVQTFDGYNPLAGISAGIAEVKTTSIATWTDKVTPTLKAMLNKRSVEVVDVQVTFLHYDEATTNKLRDIANEQAATEIARQKVKTAEQEAAASAARKANSGATCVDLYRDLAAMDQLKNVNVGFNCGQPTNLVAQPK